jgi:hypothetical protein
VGFSERNLGEISGTSVIPKVLQRIVIRITMWTVAGIDVERRGRRVYRRGAEDAKGRKGRVGN